MRVGVVGAKGPAGSPSPTGPTGLEKMPSHDAPMPNRHERRARKLTGIFIPPRQTILPRYAARHAMVLGEDATKVKPWQGRSRRERKVAARVKRIMESGRVRTA